ncbi:SH3 domain-binding glutamic acid-rich protein homolog isoform X2 [Scaptodrosophila lebanonensis]|uniref:SH3 domain-binding glutamic acid-rich protein homolog isoform X2 n=1 Tax=Drosophila lebanonensis TaxID=7225 RepID=A0A6J2TWY7_DROLE|nr:SH3 domain-binding glutamic acid-rich protein homolog isoform X2 [Scaptodrosophila lebanonensis]
MVLKVYVSNLSGNKEVKKRQQRVLMILDSKNIQYDIVDIAEPGKESEKEHMQNKSTSNGGTVSDPEPRHPLPPQIFNEDEYCGDYDAFDMANEIDTLEVFLKLAPADTTAVSSAQIELKQENGEAKEAEKAADAEADGEKPADGASGDANGEASEADKAEKKDDENGEATSENKETTETEGNEKKDENSEEKLTAATLSSTTTAAPTGSGHKSKNNSSELSESALLLGSERDASAQ